MLPRQILLSHEFRGRRDKRLLGRVGLLCDGVTENQRSSMLPSWLRNDRRCKCHPNVSDTSRRCPTGPEKSCLRPWRAQAELKACTESRRCRALPYGGLWFVALWSTEIAGGKYQFRPEFALQENTVYYLYADAQFPSQSITGNNYNPEVGGTFFANIPNGGGADDHFASRGTAPADFRLEGTALPEPQTLGLLAVGFVMLARRPG